MALDVAGRVDEEEEEVEFRVVVFGEDRLKIELDVRDLRHRAILAHDSESQPVGEESPRGAPLRVEVRLESRVRGTFRAPLVEIAGVEILAERL